MNTIRIALAAVVALALLATGSPLLAQTESITRHEDHFARHKSKAKQLGLEYCRGCHGSDLEGGPGYTGRSAEIHGDRTFVSPEKFIGPKACYSSPWSGIPGVPGSGPIDPFYGYDSNPLCSGIDQATGRFVGNNKNQAVFNEFYLSATGAQVRTKVACRYCHEEVEAKGEEVKLRGDR